MKAILLGAAFCAAACPAFAKSDTIETTGTDVAIALPLIAGGISAAKDDWRGVAQLFLDTTLTVGTAYGLKYIVPEERPDHSDNKSFPSDTAALAFAPAQYLWDRYGWQYGLPAYLAAGYVGYSRVESKQHHVWDVGASAGIAFVYSRLITTEYRPPRNLETSLYASPDSAYVTLDYRF
ncbi:MAG TPA: phosphatase PAP2 family protein [Rhizomicrobium sp.]|nr:phosphatase PAP2 family protein [Rhizomicrobium sp.]